MQVQNAEDEFFVWEDEVDGFTSSTTQKNPIKTVGSDDEPVITNSTTPVGNLELKKVIKYDDGSIESKVKYSNDGFYFKVTMKNEDDTLYTMAPFDTNGEALFYVKPNADKDDVIQIRGIPEGCTYTVTEVDEEGKEIPDGYSKITASDVTGTISGNTTKIAQIDNKIETTNLSIVKNAQLYKKNKGEADYTQVTDPEDEDLVSWENEEFTFDVNLINLIAGKEYSYKIDNILQQDKILGNYESDITTKSFTIHQGQTITILDVPVDTDYEITESTVHEDSDGISYETSIEVTGGNTANISENSTPNGDDILTLKTTADTVTFTNKKMIDVKNVPEYVNVTINKEWYEENGTTLVTWTKEDGEYIKDTNGNYVTSSTNIFPSFLTIHLGQAINIGTEEEPLYDDTSTLTNYASYSLKANEDWSYVFENLPKSVEVNINGETKEYPYVYFVTEIEPIGFENNNESSDMEQIGSCSFYVATDPDASDDVDEYEFTLKNKVVQTHELSIVKLVKGNFGNKNKEFTFDVILKNNDGKPLTGTGINVVISDLNDSDYYRKRTYTTYDGTVSVDLSEGMKATFVGLPYGTIYTIKEKTTFGYDVKSGTYETGNDINNAYDVDVDGLTGGRVQTGTLEGNINYLYVNTLQGIIPTGYLGGYTWLLLIGVVSGGGYAYLKKKRKRDRDDDENGTDKDTIKNRHEKIEDEKDFIEYVEFIDC